MMRQTRIQTNMKNRKSTRHLAMSTAKAAGTDEDKSLPEASASIVSIAAWQTGGNDAVTKETIAFKVGCVKDADVLLVLDTGESLFAHSKYLKSNPYFESHFNFLGLNTADSNIKTVRVLPPFPTAFRSIIELIYNFSIDCDEKIPEDEEDEALQYISIKQFVPLFENAQFFQIQPLIGACLHFFMKHSSDIIVQAYFAPAYLSEMSLCVLLEKLNLCDFAETARALVAKYVALENVSRATWARLGRRAPNGLNICVASDTLVQNTINYFGLKVYCERCGLAPIVDIVRNKMSCVGVVHKSFQTKDDE
ncbi:hypothetical protein BDR26DRAFT_860211 [Obelidium mucronatum]|nr:hypothetical protein BDR26DRAFT_860211 [Obelidium mucronatum]